MRTTNDPPPAAHERARSLSAIAELTECGLAQNGKPIGIRIDERSGFPVMQFGGGTITDEDVAELGSATYLIS